MWIFIKLIHILNWYPANIFSYMSSTLIGPKMIPERTEFLASTRYFIYVDIALHIQIVIHKIFTRLRKFANICGMWTTIENGPHNPIQWWLFIDVV